MTDERRDALNEAARQRLTMRAKRLVRLLELDAPDVVISNEATLILRAALLLPRSDRDILAEIMTALTERAKALAGFCTTQGCTNMAPGSLMECEWCQMMDAAHDEDIEREMGDEDDDGEETDA